MGIFGNLRSAFSAPRPDYLASPFTEGQLQKIVFSDIFGVDYAPISRAEAMGIPSLSKARNLICATIANLPLRVANTAGVLPEAQQPTWAYRTDGAISPFMRMIWTADDLLFYGHSLWGVTRGSEGQILTADRVPYEWWKISPEGALLINDKPVDASQVIYFPGAVEGILDKDGSSLRAAQSIAAAVESRVKNPIPVMEVHGTGDGASDLTPEEAKEIVVDYNKARRDVDGATVYTPPSVQLIAHGDKSDAGFMVEGRNAVRLDMANITGVPAALLDGSVSQSSLTYSTQEGRRNEFVDYGLNIWMNTISGRLSADDVVARGLHTVFDLSDLITTTPAAIGPAEQD